MRGLFLALVALSACGADAPANTPDAGGDPSGSRTVTVSVSTPLPPTLASNCAGSPSALEALLLGLYETGACPLAISGGTVAGSCAGVAIDQNVQTTLFYRRAAGMTAIAEQGKLLELPGTSPDVVSLSFAGVALSDPYDSDGDGQSNLDEWCAGTL